MFYLGRIRTIIWMSKKKFERVGYCTKISDFSICLTASLKGNKCQIKLFLKFKTIALKKKIVRKKH